MLDKKANWTKPEINTYSKDVVRSGSNVSLAEASIIKTGS